MPFTKKELAEMARADAEIDAEFALTEAEIAASRMVDEAAITGRLTAQVRDKKQRYAATRKQYEATHAVQIKAQRRRYFQQNKEKHNEQQRVWRAQNREQVNARQRGYHAAHRETALAENGGHCASRSSAYGSRKQKKSAQERAAFASRWMDEPAVGLGSGVNAHLCSAPKKIQQRQREYYGSQLATALRRVRVLAGPMSAEANARFANCCGDLGVGE